jgi:hypothetical protein
MRYSRFPNEHHVQNTLLLLPVGTLYHGTPKQHAVGKVLSSSVAHVTLACGRGSMHPQRPDGAGSSAAER